MNEIVSASAAAAVRYLLIGSAAAAILVPLAWLAIRTARLRAPVYRHTIWLYCLTGAAVLPALCLCGPKLTLRVLPAPAQVGEAPTPPPVQPAYESEGTGVPEVPQRIAMPLVQGPTVAPVRNMPSHTPTSPAITISWKVAVAGAWLAGLAIMLARLAIAWLRLQGIRRGATPVEPVECADDLSDRKLEIRLTEQLPGPVCLGILRPAILLPHLMYRGASSKNLRMILAHELAHIDRRDCWVNLFQRLLEAAFFFHPLVWLASRQLTHERERICDNWVLARGACVDDYMQLLSDIGERILMKTRHLPAVALFEGGLLSRVRSLLDPQHSRSTRMTRRSAWACALSFVLCFAAMGTVRLGARPNPDVSSMPATAVLLTGSGVSMAGSADANDPAFRPQEESLGPTERRPDGNCSLSGWVISGLTGEPVGHATVYLFSIATHDAVFIKVASDGSFVFKDIAAGEYSLRTSHVEGYQDTPYNPEGKTSNLPTFTLNEGEHRMNVELRAKPACTISGRVLDEAGNPPSLGTLWVYAWQEKDTDDGCAGRFNVIRQAIVQPDGSYSLDGLDARPTYVMAVDVRSENKDEYYPPCYHPGTLDRAKATVIPFDKTPIAENVDIRLQTSGEYALEGTITDESTGLPIEKALVVVHHTDMLFDQITAYTDAQGHYRLDTVSPGELLVHVDAKPFGYARKRQLLTLGAETKENRLDLSLKPGVTIRGRFVDTDGKDVEFTWSTFGQAYHYVAGDPSAGGPSWSGSANRYSVAETKGHVTFLGGSGDYHSEQMNYPTAGTFVIEGVLPGLTFLNFEPKATDLTVQSILYKGQNIVPAGFETTLAERQIEDVAIVIARVPQPARRR